MENMNPNQTLELKNLILVSFTEDGCFLNPQKKNTKPTYVVMSTVFGHNSNPSQFYNMEHMNHNHIHRMNPIQS